MQPNEIGDGMGKIGDDEPPEAKRKKPYPSLRKLARREDEWHAKREKRK